MRTPNIDYSLGWEFEAIKRAVVTPKGVEVGHDSSVRGEHAEYKLKRAIVKSPVDGIMALHRLITLRRLEIDNSCGFHVHVGIIPLDRKLPDDFHQIWAAWSVVLAKQVEDYAFKAVPQSRMNNEFCQKWRGNLLSAGVIHGNYSSNKYDNDRRYWLNVTEMFRPGGIGTIEFRLMGDSFSFQHLLAWTLSCLAFGRSISRLISDPSRLDYEAEAMKEAYSIVERAMDGKMNKYGIISLMQIAGVEVARFDNLNKFIAAKIPKSAPALNNGDTEVLMLHRHHGDGDDYPPYGVTREGCICNRCNYFRWERKSKKLKASEPAGIGAAGIGAIGSGAAYPWMETSAQVATAALRYDDIQRSLMAMRADSFRITQPSPFIPTPTEYIDTAETETSEPAF